MISNAQPVQFASDKDRLQHPWYIDRGCPMPRPRSFSLSAVPNRYVAWNELTQVSTVGVGESSSSAMCQPINSASLSAASYRRAKVKGQTRWLLIVFLCIVLAALLSFLIFFSMTNQKQRGIERAELPRSSNPTPSGVHANPVPVPPGFQNNGWPKHPYDPSHVPDFRQNVPAFQNGGPPPLRQAQEPHPPRMEHRRSVPGVPEPSRNFVPEPSSRYQQVPNREPVRRSPDPQQRTKPPQRTEPPQRTPQRTEPPQRTSFSEAPKTKKEERAEARKKIHEFQNRTESAHGTVNETASESDYFKSADSNFNAPNSNSTAAVNQTFKLVFEAPKNPFQEYFFASDGTFFIVSHEDPDDVTLEVLVEE